MMIQKGRSCGTTEADAKQLEKQIEIIALKGIPGSEVIIADCAWVPVYNGKEQLTGINLVAKPKGRITNIGLPKDEQK